MDARALLIAGWLVIAGVPLLGAGFANGDIAAYVVEAGGHGPPERWTHVGYWAVARVMAPMAGAQLAPWLDALNLMCAAVVVLAAARLAERQGGSGWVASLGAVAVVLPMATWAEVDTPWLALVMLAAAGSPWWVVAAATVSPVALLAVPWLTQVRPDRRRDLWLAVAIAVGALSLVSLGGWWFGPRGVLMGPLPRVGRASLAWLNHLPWLLLPAALWGVRAHARPGPWLALLPLLLAPPDVPAWSVGGLALAVAAARAPVKLPVWSAAGIPVAIGLALWASVQHTRQIRLDSALVQRVAAQLGPDDGLVAPWTWGARVSVARTGTVYGGRWLAEPPVRDQWRRWCVDPPARVWRFQSRAVAPMRHPACGPATDAP